MSRAFDAVLWALFWIFVGVLGSAAMVQMCGCVSAPGRLLVGGELNRVARVRDAWNARQSLPEAGAACEEMMARARIEIAQTHEQMYFLTGYCGRTAERDPAGQVPREGDLVCNNGRAAAATRHYTEGFWLAAAFDDGDPFIVVWHEAYPKVLYHEGAHLISECASGNPDRLHEQEEVWGPAGVVREVRSFDSP